eukprot:843038-Ditylum_brightwellii.AAC.1
MEDIKLGMAQIVTSINNISLQIIYMLLQGQLPQVQQNPTVTQTTQSQSNQATKGNNSYNPASKVKHPALNKVALLRLERRENEFAKRKQDQKIVNTINGNTTKRRRDTTTKQQQQQQAKNQQQQRQQQNRKDTTTT